MCKGPNENINHINSSHGTRCVKALVNNINRINILYATRCVKALVNYITHINILYGNARKVHFGTNCVWKVALRQFVYTYCSNKHQHDYNPAHPALIIASCILYLCNMVWIWFSYLLCICESFPALLLTLSRCLPYSPVSLTYVPSLPHTCSLSLNNSLPYSYLPLFFI